MCVAQCLESMSLDMNSQRALCVFGQCSFCTGKMVIDEIRCLGGTVERLKFSRKAAKS